MTVGKRVPWTWRDVIKKALNNLEGVDHLCKIYDEVRKIAHKFGKSPPRNFEETIRDALQAGCPESKGYQGGPEDFRMLGDGRWALRNYNPLKAR